MPPRERLPMRFVRSKAFNVWLESLTFHTDVRLRTVSSNARMFFRRASAPGVRLQSFLVVDGELRPAPDGISAAQPHYRARDLELIEFQVTRRLRAKPFVYRGGTVRFSDCAGICSQALGQFTTTTQQTPISPISEVVVVKVVQPDRQLGLHQ